MIYVLQDKLDDKLCNDFIMFYKYAKWLQQDSKVTIPGSNDYIIDEIRKSKYVRLFPKFFYKETNFIYSIIYENSYKLFNYDLWDHSVGKEDIKIIKYKKDDFFNWHYDYSNQLKSIRKINFSIQLSDSNSYEGGDLEFFELSIPYNKSKGSIIIYPSFFPHRITPVTKGIRYCLVGHLNGPDFK